jgi:response regulator RpfG family c-di-GMP phosphodiesterase
MAKLAFVVVDDAKQRDDYVPVLKRGGFKVETFNDEATALAALQKRSPHVVVVHFDENMPRTVEFIKELHARDSTICILYFTYYGKPDLHARAIAAGAFAVREKPYSLYDENLLTLLRMAYEESWKRKRAAGMHQALVLMPFKEEFDEVYRVAIKEPLTEMGYKCERIDELTFVGDVVQKLYDKLEYAGLIIADMTGLNPNVFYELGYADALKKTVILVTQTAANVPFDVRARRFITYEGGMLQLKERLIDTVKSLEDASEV